jgi:hypothetical protein
MKYISLIQFLACFGFGIYESTQNNMFCVVWIGAAIIYYINFKKEEDL